MAFSSRPRTSRRRPAVLVALAVGAVLVVLGLAVFQPWKLFVDREVDESLPGVLPAVIPGPAGWHVFDDGAYVDLGKLEGNVGNSNYPIPDGVDLDDLSSVSIWYDRFDVSFAAAALT